MMKTILALLFIVFIYFLQQEKVYDNDVIIFGSSLPKTGVMKEFGNSVYKGANAYFKYVNDNNILNGKQIKLIAYDDKYEPDIMLENTNKLLMQKDLFLLFAFVGTPTIKRILFNIENSNIPFISPITGAQFLRQNNYSNIINFRSSYHEEIEHIIDYLYNDKNIRKFAVFYQNDDYGESGYISAIDILKKYNLKHLSSGSYKRNTLSLKQALNNISHSKPEAIIMIGAYQANSVFINKAKKNKNLNDVIFANISFGNADAMIKELDYNTSNIIFSQVVPYYKQNTAIINQYKKIFKKYYPRDAYDFISLESFLSAKITIEALKNIGEDITRSRFLEEIKKTSKNNKYFYNKVYLYKFYENNFIEINSKDKSLR